METENRFAHRNKRNFESINRTSVPQTRKGKHHELVEQILQELSDLRGKKALKIQRAALGASRVEHIRAALSRASARMHLPIATKVDDEYFYVWRQD